ncbi:MAG: SDR family oxidoreductase [Lactobacillales bacterium]|jgi:enoyl-[acyl-carrier protein] reductase I|nr:SDR family oxidoreductase [Lactobacillales bacterium]
MTKGIMAGKKGLIMGVANDHSIAWGIAKQLAEQGAEIAFTYQGEALEKRVRPLAESIGSDLLIPADVLDAASMDRAFATIKEKWGKMDFVVHAIAFSDKNELKGRYVDTTPGNFTNSMMISCFSFTDVCKRAAELMTDGGSCLTLTYLGAERYLPNYNVMGVAKAALEASIHYIAFDLGHQNIRVNAISAGPIRTLAAAGIGDFRQILGWTENNSALCRNVTIDDVGGAGMFLLSDLASGITGEIVHVDAGYHKNAMINPRNAQKSAELLSTFKLT